MIGADVLQQLFAVPHQEQQGKPSPRHQDSCQLQRGWPQIVCRRTIEPPGTGQPEIATASRLS